MKSSIIAPLYLLLVLLQCCGCLQATKPKTLEVLNRSTLGERQLDAILPDVLFHHSDDTINSELMDHLDNLDVAIDQLSNKSTTDWDELDNNLPRSLIKKKWSWNIFKKRISKKVEKWNELIEATSSINVSSSSNDNTDKNIWRSTKNSNLIAKAHHRLSIMSTHPKIAKWVEKLGVGFNSAYQKALASSIGRKAISNAVFFNTSSSSTRKITRLEHMLATSIPEKDRALIRKDLEKTEEAANSNGLVKRYNHNRSKAMPALVSIRV